MHKNDAILSDYPIIRRFCTIWLVKYLEYNFKWQNERAYVFYVDCVVIDFSQLTVYRYFSEILFYFLFFLYNI